ncbi:pyridoxamine 5'-phosphate oxidase family protein [Cohaesibacter celericrescens]|uniref:Pyridoxamine 5'-phosphate oxidase family protein n=1 Tax=Cohaesibacter celericrescens TaxID=2067669 RepID=A0A2N5XM42_9HYPH|nr:pyridoxamine 5'-phosphate oxidase family protein [Cohaesibacter celericrescens]PLW75555.1 pyridoxamine 5'-phosphate oxidase family protein [Cohaesibacter celericrescens]PLW78962.1 pyridoxamine 5'-phosphate oxidase family protein [Cohaesibacter celericrescens]
MTQTSCQEKTFPVTEANKIRVAKRAHYDEATVHAILDEGLIAQVGFVQDGNPIVLPMVYARIGDQLYIHGAKATRLLKQLKKGLPVCLNVTLVDGLVVGRSAFHHSMNFRSVNIHGTAKLVEDEQEKYDALVAVTDHLAPGRWDETRAMTTKEANATTVISVTIETAAAKVRSGMPIDDEEDYASDHWAGIVPITTAYGQPIDDARLKQGIPVADSIKALSNRR